MNTKLQREKIKKNASLKYKKKFECRYAKINQRYNTIGFVAVKKSKKIERNLES